MLYSFSDIQTAKFLIRHFSENDVLTDTEQERVTQADLVRLEQMVSYCKTDRCLRGYILDYFGQSHPESCRNCGNCDTDAAKTDITRQAQIILSGILEVHQTLGYSVGLTTIVRLLRGSTDKRIMSLHLNELSCHELLHDTSRTDIRAMLDALERQGFLNVHPDHGAILPTEKARDVLRGTKAVEMTLGRSAAPAISSRPAPSSDSGLLQVLKELRLRLSHEADVPAYVIFSNATLQDMAEKAPRTPDEFLRVKGVGQYKAEQYGEVFLNTITRYLDEKG